jgi:hypothetical protein
MAIQIRAVRLPAVVSTSVDDARGPRLKIRDREGLSDVLLEEELPQSAKYHSKSS